MYTSLACTYPGTVYQPYQPIFFQSLRNRLAYKLYVSDVCSRFIFRCIDGVHVDGSNIGISRVIFRSCAGRDQVSQGAVIGNYLQLELIPFSHGHLPEAGREIQIDRIMNVDDKGPLAKKPLEASPRAVSQL